MAKIVARKKVEEVAEPAAGVLTEIRRYGRQIWLAGLGAYAKAGEEGLNYFKELIRAGEEAEQQGKKLVSEQVEAANSQIDSMKSGVKTGIETRFERLEKAFDDRIAAALNRLGIPSRQDIDGLSAKLDVLNDMLTRVAKTQ
ncbi:phasin family protein [Zestomonas thermotolerans]|jgi:poly(hydroxyalkanoate) granule-associated protein|uniref:phasin family protein n=1 Tax=Zestomonas thermotolerans TaxID=157784 RepID=UPI000483DF8F|nr:phasin family protein [Pseudomonas thermotolerans]